MTRHFYLLLLYAIPFMLSLKVSAQQLPVYGGFYAEPFLYNPAELAGDGYMSVTLNNRQQWRGIDGAPMVSTLMFQTPFDYKKGAVGATVRSFQRGVINSIDFLASYNYTVYLTKTTTLHFGLSGGVTSTSLSLDADEIAADPLLVGFLDNNMQLIGNFGMKVKTASGLNLGVALPRLINPSYTEIDNFTNYSISPFDQISVMAYFKRKLDKKIVTRRVKGVNRRVELEDAYAPLQLYVLYNYGKLVDNRIEAALTLDIGEYLMVGGGYRLDYGPIGLMGLKFANFQLNYAYEPASDQVEGFVQGTHELQLKYRIGERKNLQRSKPMLRTIVKTDTRRARFTHDDLEEGGTSTSDGERTKQFYVVLRNFRTFEEADRYVQWLEEKRELNSDIFYNKKDKKFYVYIYKTTKSRDANQEKKAVEELTKFKNVRIIIIEE